ncbi:MAG: hypothetical protein CEN91_322 [Candidatus Berkelbacteria bacterium Licking1014_85]|uniref:Uncharacterized protein n=1 Tax=Candidatus Berkelbacteria bacterium Licking1014_85 TaxID=2017148 RepID=A0A554LJE7_9BACT|nr:MAG: hypothetical protein CEN91_322 [Candidatus Berkelbacteria bacterium Licking1014_85]
MRKLLNRNIIILFESISKMTKKIEKKIRNKIDLFLFVSNLTEWHFSCRKSFNDVWKKYPHSLTVIEKELIIKFKQILIKYFKKNNEFLLVQFIQNETELNKNNVLNNLREVYKILKIFKSRYSNFYSQQRNNISKVEDYSKNLQKKYRIQIQKIRQFYDVKSNQPYQIFVTLGQNAKLSAGAMYFNVNNFGYIFLQFGDYTLSKNNSELDEIIIHEISHHFEKVSYKTDLYKKFSPMLEVDREFKKIGVKKEDILSEVINKSIVCFVLNNYRNSIINKPSDLTQKYYQKIQKCAKKLTQYFQSNKNININQKVCKMVANLWNGIQP